MDKRKSEFFGELLEVLANETKEPIIVCKNEERKLIYLCMNITNYDNKDNITDEQYEAITSIYKQFRQVLTDYLKENNIQIKDKEE